MAASTTAGEPGIAGPQPEPVAQLSSAAVAPKTQLRGDQMYRHRMWVGLFAALALVFSTGIVSPPALAQDPGNSGAAHACQQGGYQDLRRADGTSFKNAGDCVSYAAQGGSLLAPPDLTTSKTCAPTSIASGGTVTCTITVTNAAGAAPALVSAGTLLVRDTITGTASTVTTITGTSAPSGYNCVNAGVISGSIIVNCSATSAGSIPGSATRVFTVTATITNLASTAQTVTDTAAADPNSAITESNEGNNTSTPATSVTVAPAGTVVPLIDDCGGAAGGACDNIGPPVGSVSYTKTSAGALQFTFTVTGAAANTTYAVWLVCGPTHAAVCGAQQFGTLTTDSSGNANAVITASAATLQLLHPAPGTHTDHLDLVPPGGGGLSTTAANPITYSTP